MFLLCAYFNFEVNNCLAWHPVKLALTLRTLLFLILFPCLSHFSFLLYTIFNPLIPSHLGIITTVMATRLIQLNLCKFIKEIWDYSKSFVCMLFGHIFYSENGILYLWWRNQRKMVLNFHFAVVLDSMG